MVSIKNSIILHIVSAAVYVIQVTDWNNMFIQDSSCISNKLLVYNDGCVGT